MDPIYSYALKTTINEIRSVSPQVTNAFVFRKDGEIVAKDDDTSEETINNAINIFNEMNEHTEVFGHLENLSVQCSNSQVTFTPCIKDFYLATVSSRETDGKIFYAITRILVPTIIKLVNQLTDSSDSQLIFLEKPKPKAPAKIIEPEPEPEIKQIKPVETKPVQDPIIEPKHEPVKQPEKPPEPVFEPPLVKVPVHQLMVDKLTGILTSSDTVRVDYGILATWSETYEGRNITRVKIETLKMKSVECKVKTIKDNSIKGIIQIPERLLQALELSKGELVMVNPIIQN